MSAQLDLCNRALIAVGESPIASLEATAKPAVLLRALWAPLRDELLRGHPWNFAMGRAALPALSAAPAWDYAYAYQLPADCLRVWQVDLSDPAARWKVEGTRIVTDETAPLNILYIRSTDEVGNYAADFASALVARIAADLAMPIAQSASLRATLVKEAQALLRTARSMDGQEGQPDRVISDWLIDARLSGSGSSQPFAGTSAGSGSFSLDGSTLG